MLFRSPTAVVVSAECWGETPLSKIRLLGERVGLPPIGGDRARVPPATDDGEMSSPRWTVEGVVGLPPVVRASSRRKEPLWLR